MRLLTKICSTILACASMLSLFLIIGTAGAIEVNDITLEAGVKEMATWLILMVVCGILSKAFAVYMED